MHALFIIQEVFIIILLALYSAIGGSFLCTDWLKTSHKWFNLDAIISSDYFISLVRLIIGQQLSVTASRKIYERLVSLTNDDTSPEKILSLPDEAIREIGVSYRKISYIKDLSKKVINNELDLKRIDTRSNEEVISLLTSVKGIGEWTAHMFLIFTLERVNVLAVLDVGLHRRAKWLYGGEDGKQVLLEKAKNWSPYESIASLYLWEIVNSGMIVKYKAFDEFVQVYNPISKFQ